MVVLVEDYAAPDPERSTGHRGRASVRLTG
jgi:hypothetical protein